MRASGYGLVVHIVYCQFTCILWTNLVREELDKRDPDRHAHFHDFSYQLQNLN